MDTKDNQESASADESNDMFAFFAQKKEILIAGAVLGTLVAVVVSFSHMSFGDKNTEEVNVTSAGIWLDIKDTDEGKNEGRLGGLPIQVENEDAENGKAATNEENGEVTSVGDGESKDVGYGTGYGDSEYSELTKTDNGRIIKKGKVKSGVPVIKEIVKMGVSYKDAHQVIMSLEKVYDFTKSRPGQEFEIVLDQNGTIKSFRYNVSLTEIYKAVRTINGFESKKVEVKTVKKLKYFGGTIESSLFKTLKLLGARSALAVNVADVLSNMVNFYKHQRPGDTIRIMVEEESLKGDFLKYGHVLAFEYNSIKNGKKRFFYYDTAKSKVFYYDKKMVSVPFSTIIIPLYYTRISSRFGFRYHPILKRKKLHNGVDFAASRDTPVWACAPGEVILAARKGANGNLVSILHDDGLISHYAHLQRFAPGIKKGVKVRQKQVIAYVGSTGRSTGPHLHFGLKKNGRFLDPLKYKVRPGKKIPGAHAAKLRKIIRQRGKILDTVKILPPSQPIKDVPEEIPAMGY